MEDTRFLDSLARVVPALTQGLIIVAQQVDALRASVERRDDVPHPSESRNTRAPASTYSVKPS